MTRSPGNFRVIPFKQLLKYPLFSRFKVHCEKCLLLSGQFESMDIYKTHCDLCPAIFNTTTALLRHRSAKHAEAASVASLPFYSGEKMIDLPSRRWKGRRPLNYKQWLSGVVDSFNSCLHPKVPGNQSCRSSACSCIDHEMNALFSAMFLLRLMKLGYY